MNKVDDYLRLVTSQHNKREKFIATVRSTIEPLIDCLNCLDELNEKYEIDRASGDQLQTIADWVGAENAISNGIAIEFFGFADQEAAATFGETDDSTAGGYWRESGVNSYRALQMTNEQFKQVVKAKILLNQSDCSLNSAKTIISLITNIPFLIKDNLNMTVSFKFLDTYKDADRELVRMMFPLPSGVKLLFEGEDDY